MFGKHNVGYIFPITMSTNQTTESFAGIVELVETSDEFLWVYSDTLTIAEASRGSMKLLGVSIVPLNTHECFCFECLL